MAWLVLAAIEVASVQPVTLSSKWLGVTLDPSGSFSVVDKRAKITWQSTQHITPFRNLQKLPDRKVSFQTEARQRGGAKPFPVTVTMWLEGDELVVEASVSDPKMQVGTFSFLPPLPPTDPPRSELLIPYYGNGIAVPVDGKEFRGWFFSTYGAFDMPWVGVTDGKIGYLLLWDGRSADDGNCHIDPVKTPHGELLAPAAFHDPTMRRFGYPRRIRYIFVAEGGHVGLCKRYREYAKRNGFLVTLEEKAKRKPDVKLLAGAPNVWGGNPQFAREAKRAGIDRMLINGVWSAKEMEAVKALGYLNSRYDNYEDLYTCCPNHTQPYNIGTIEDCVLRADGNRQVSWVTWDKKHTAHKRCSLLQLDVARKYIVDQLKRHPHNGWFLDVTTAAALLECYDEKHPHDRTQDREEKRRLAKFVDDELRLVLGGEHGRWWGVDIYDYWEGMMSHPFYTWPAGYLRPPEKRDEIGERYLEWGLGHRRRVPLWELVFHDCVVSYWYWGDSTDFLYQVAPELSDKKDAFNILYGTPPMFWVNHLGFTWDDPNLKRRLLQSYRIVCKLHEQIAFDEMLSHEWLTPDRDVQRTVFGRPGAKTGTTEVVVNFGEKPFVLSRDGQKFVLPQYGFYARGPKITQFRNIIGDRTVTFVRTPDYAFCDAGGKRHDFGIVITEGEVTMKLEKPGQILILIGEGTREVSLRPLQFVPKFNAKSARLVWLSDDGTSQTVEVVKEDVVKLALGKWRSALLVWGRAASKPNFAVAKVSLTPKEPKHGQPLKVTATLLNNGLARGNAYFALYLDRVSPTTLLAKRTITLTAGQQRSVSVTLDTKGIDGQRLIVACVDPIKPKDELALADNERTVSFNVAVDYSRWRFGFEVNVHADGIRRLDEPVTVDVDWGKLAGALEGVSIDPNSVRVVEVGDGNRKVLPCAFEPTDPKSRCGKLTFLLVGETPPNGIRRFRVIADAQKGVRYFPLPSDLRWDKETKTVTTPFYRLRFGDDGMVRGWVSLTPDAPKRSFLRSLGVSSAKTGWVDEIGEVEAVKCLDVNPVSAVVQVTKWLRGDFHIVRTFTFYPRHFTVEIEADKPGIYIYSRAYYLLPCNFADDKGNKAVVDGKGEGEGVIGKNPKPKWYAVYSDTWAHSCIALSQFDNLTYWDAGGAWGGIAFNTGQTRGIRLAYVLHGGQKDAAFAAWDYERLTKPPRVVILARGKH